MYTTYTFDNQIYIAKISIIATIEFTFFALTFASTFLLIYAPETPSKW